MNAILSKLKDYWWLLGIIGMVSLPYIQDKLGINSIQTEQKALIEQNKQLVQSLKEAQCNNITILKSFIRLQNEIFNSNEILFAKLSVDSLDVASTRTRVGDAKMEVLRDLEKLSKQNECLF